MSDGVQNVLEKLQQRKGGGQPSQPAAQSAAAEAGGRIDIDRIWADPTQPRRVVPALLRQQWNGDPRQTPALFDAWIELVAERRQVEAGVMHHYYQTMVLGTNQDAPDAAPGAENVLQGLAFLAASIRMTKLNNPIVVVPHESGAFIIEQGERRWLAYHLLRYFGVEMDYRIPARQEQYLDRFRQVSENTAREDLSNIARARQYALLVMQVNADQQLFKPLDQFETERDFYAQALDLRIPHGQISNVLNGCGVRSRGSLAAYRETLMLPPDAWIEADEAGWSKQQIADVLKKITAVINSKNNTNSGSKTVKKPKPYRQPLKAFRTNFEANLERASNPEKLIAELDDLEQWILDVRSRYQNQ